MDNSTLSKYVDDWMEESKTKIKSFEETVADLKKENRILREEIEYIKLDTKSKQSLIVDLEKKNTGNTEQVKYLKESLERVELQLKEMHRVSDTGQRSYEKPDMKLQYLESKITELELDLHKQNHGKFVWRINTVRDKMNETRNEVEPEFVSNPFYSHKNGYKLRLEIDFDKGADGKNTHLSVWFRILKGEFDDVLPWPFMHDVTLSLINQKTGIVYLSRKAKFENVPSNSAYNKPTTDENCGTGFPRFIKLARLFGKPNICEKDTIFIKCTVNLLFSENDE